MLVPGDFGQGDVDAENARQRALDLDVEPGDDGRAALVIAVLIGIPRIPAAVQLVQASRGGSCGRR